MRTFRIRYTKTIESIVELEGKTITDAWKLVKADNLIPDGPDRNIVWMREGELTYKAVDTEEISRHMTSVPKN